MTRTTLFFILALLVPLLLGQPAITQGQVASPYLLYLPLVTRADTVQILAGPASPTSDRHAQFTFRATGAVECALNDAPFAPCTTPHTLLGLGLGTHRLAVRPLGQPALSSQYQWQVVSIFDLPHPNWRYDGDTPPPDPEGGSFRIKCEFAHANYDDPIVYPNGQGLAHLHLYLGNTQADYASTFASLMTSGDSTCHGTPFNRSAYWVPALLAPVGEQNGEPVYQFVLPQAGADTTDVYYKTAVDDVSTIQPMPAGLHMIAGNAAATGPQPSEVVRWSCRSWVGTAEFRPFIPRCAVGDWVLLSIIFPSCWDGANLYLPHQSHMAYPTVSWQSGQWVHHCPASHPVPLPVVSYNLRYPVTAELAPAGDSRYWRLASDNYTIDDEMPGGYSAHGDWFMAWHPEVMATLIAHCIQPGRSCTNGDLGNGWQMVGQALGTQAVPPILNGGMGDRPHLTHTFPPAQMAICAVGN